MFFNKKIITNTVFLVSILTFPFLAFAIYPEDNNSNNREPSVKMDSETVRQSNSTNIGYGNRGFNVGDSKNSIMGDMHIEVGHKNVEINMGKDSNNNFVDTSINSMIVIGDMNK